MVTTMSRVWKHACIVAYIMPTCSSRREAQVGQIICISRHRLRFAFSEKHPIVWMHIADWLIPKNHKVPHGWYLLCSCNSSFDIGWMCNNHLGLCFRKLMHQFIHSVIGIGRTYHTSCSMMIKLCISSFILVLHTYTLSLSLLPATSVPNNTTA